MELQDLLLMTIERDASDLHLKAGQPPILRIYGRLTRTELPVLTSEEIQRMMYTILTEEQKRRFERERELDMAYALPGKARFRVNMSWQRRCVGASLRQIPAKVRTIDELGLPQVLKKLAMMPRGLVLVTGPTGSGKSTTLAAMIDYINENRRAHILTIEDPIEFVHQDKKSTITQREVGTDTKSFAEALRHAMRHTPDVILVGEMRDLETISLAITAAETGHLVFATLHTNDAPQTVDRIIDVFPPAQQNQIRMQLSLTLAGVASQQLLPRADGKGRIAAFEIMIVTPAIRALIREAKTHQLYSIIQTSGELGMIAMDHYLLQLYEKGVVAYEEALLKSSNPREFEQRAAPIRAQRGDKPILTE